MLKKVVHRRTAYLCLAVEIQNWMSIQFEFNFFISLILKHEQGCDNEVCSVTFWGHISWWGCSQNDNESSHMWNLFFIQCTGFQSCMQCLTLTLHDKNNPQQSLSAWYSRCRLRRWSYPHIGHRGGRVEELADDVGGGGDAEDDGAEDLLPPGQQKHRVLSPATLTSSTIPLYQADGTVTFPPVTLAVGEVVTVVYGEEKQKSVSEARILFYV